MNWTARTGSLREGWKARSPGSAGNAMRAVCEDAPSLFTALFLLKKHTGIYYDFFSVCPDVFVQQCDIVLHAASPSL